MTVIISGTDGVSDVDGTAGTPALRGTDANTGIFFGADQVGVATNGVERVEFGNSETVFNDGGADVDFRVEGDTNANLLFVDASTDRVGIGTSSPASRLSIQDTAGTGDFGNGVLLDLFGGSISAIDTGVGISFTRTGSQMAFIQARRESASTEAAYLAFATQTSAGSHPERMRITSGGTFAVGNVGTGSTALTGCQLQGDGAGLFVREADVVVFINRKTNDGTLIDFRQDGATEGTISVSGNTVSYNAFSGGHWSQLQEGRGYNPEIPRGTVMSTIGEMCLWKSVEWTETIQHEATEEKKAWTETSTKRETYLGDLPVGATFEEDGFTKTVVDDGNERLPKVKISDVVGDKAVYGVFQTWDEVEDMLVTSLGAFVVRIAAGITVEIGDLLESNGDGCAKVQDDDVIRSKTIAKVTSTAPTDTYADGSYTVPAVIYCG